ncbi:hypothetical protein QJQ45_019240 [Haematococcus lacustris]|nr:hypothetical protein QJQ45_019240 [Haematococcus lacustris]
MKPIPIHFTSCMVKLPQPLLACLEGLYRDDGPHRTPPATPDQGVKQGCPISPLLFVLYVHDISKEFLGPVDAVRVQGTPVTHFMYADDLTLVSTSSHGLQRLVCQLQGFADRKHLTVNVGKSKLITKASVQEHLMRGPQHRGIRLLPGEVAVFEQPSSAWTVAMLKQLDEGHVRGDNNSLNANATTIITSITEYYRHPGRFIRWWCKAVGVVEEGFSRAMKKHFPQLVLGRLDYSLPDRQHKWRLPSNSVLRQPRWREEVVKHRRLLGLAATWREGQDSIGKRGAGRLPIEKRVRYVLFVNRSLEGWQAAHDTCPRPFTMLPMVGRQIDADSLPHWQKFIQYSQLQNSGWEFARRVETDGVSNPRLAPPAQAQPPPPAQAQPPPAAPGPAPRPQAPPGGRWLDRDTNGCLNLQRIGESMQRPLELCSWTDLKALPPVGKEYQQGYKLPRGAIAKFRLYGGKQVGFGLK